MPPPLRVDAAIRLPPLAPNGVAASDAAGLHPAIATSATPASAQAAHFDLFVNTYFLICRLLSR
ncbi:MAG TPA: hypothetical protein VGG29_11510 [Caulobacteraceae bacterium]|jgi:hypothetical protein